MTKDSPEYQRLKAEHEAKEKYKHDHPEEYPWFIYYQFGWHNMTYITDNEKDQAVKFYHLHGSDELGYCRYGRQPIFITRRGDK